MFDQGKVTRSTLKGGFFFSILRSLFSYPVSWILYWFCACLVRCRLTRVSVSRAIKPFAESGRPPDWFSQKVWPSWKLAGAQKTKTDLNLWSVSHTVKFILSSDLTLTALCFQIFRATGDHRGPKVRIYMTGLFCRLTKEMNSFRLMCGPVKKVSVYLLAAEGSEGRKVKWWRPSRTWSFGGWRLTGLRSWRSWSTRRRKPTGLLSPPRTSCSTPSRTSRNELPSLQEAEERSGTDSSRTPGLQVRGNMGRNPSVRGHLSFTHLVSHLCL